MEKKLGGYWRRGGADYSEGLRLSGVEAPNGWMLVSRWQESN
jgi:hypothetical protein